MTDRIKHLIGKFWRDEATVDEMQELLDLLNENNAAWKTLLERHFTLGEGEALDGITIEKKKELLKSIHSQITIDEVKHRKNRINYLKIATYAAAILLLIGNVALYFFRHQDTASFSVAERIEQHELVEKVNSTNREIRFLLPDSSLIILSPRSSIIYSRNFGISDRQIKLHGEANFQVAHDPTRPFVVTANRYATIALGTEFTVSTAEKGKTLIQLFSGKVVVRATEGSKFKIDDIYMKPGERLSISDQDSYVKLEPAIAHRRTVKGKRKDYSTNEHALVFNKEPLKVLFSSLEKRFAIQIIYDDTNHPGLTFTGTIEHSDSLDAILGIVCEMNGLMFSKTQGAIVISDN